MSNKYDRVSYPDDLHFAQHGDGEGEEYHRTGNGIYNDYTVEVTPKPFTQTFKVACFNFERSNKKKFIYGGVVATVVVLIMMIIVISTAGSKKSSPPPSSNQKEYGLLAYPVSPQGTSVISYDPTINKSYMPYFDNLVYHLHDYSAVDQLSQPDKYVKCTNTTTSLAPGELCLQTTEQFGTNCHPYNMFGLQGGRPCVLLVLNIPPDSPMPKPFNFSGSQNAKLQELLGEKHSDNSVSVSCEGKEQADKDLIGTSNISGPPIAYHPNQGFPHYYFLGRKHLDYFPPAVMLQFNTIPTEHEVNVRCTAWAGIFEQGQPWDTDVYTTVFTFNLKAIV